MLAASCSAVESFLPSAPLRSAPAASCRMSVLVSPAVAHILVQGVKPNPGTYQGRTLRMCGLQLESRCKTRICCMHLDRCTRFHGAIRWAGTAVHRTLCMRPPILNCQSRAPLHRTEFARRIQFSGDLRHLGTVLGGRLCIRLQNLLCFHQGKYQSHTECLAACIPQIYVIWHLGT